VAEVEHPALEEGHWWACERPEHEPVPFKQHYRPKCARCFAAWRVAAEQPRATFITPSNPTPRSLHPGHTEAELWLWWMEGIVPSD
jgi:hypothetical protein